MVPAVVNSTDGDSLDYGTSVVIATATVFPETVPDEEGSGVIGIFLGIGMLFFFDKSLNRLFSLVAFPS